LRSQDAVAYAGEFLGGVEVSLRSLVVRGCGATATVHHRAVVKTLLVVDVFTLDLRVCLNLERFTINWGRALQVVSNAQDC
jgi:hypothetical protein